jgi:NAD(P)-dependent dehydrogenase (short-subunit alcohol dehydrogenase family)
MAVRKTIFVTGGGSGIGRAIAIRFANEGWFVGLGDVNEQGMAETEALLPGGYSYCHKFDVADREEWDEALRIVARASGGRIDVVANNAGISLGGPLEEYARDEIDRILDVNLKGVIYGAQAAYPWLRQTAPGSCLVNTASAAALFGMANQSLYGATKAAVRSLTESLDAEWAPEGIRVRSLMPSFIDTPLLQNTPNRKRNVKIREAVVEAGLEFTPVEEVADAAWNSVTSGRLHHVVGKTARKMRLLAKWAPNFLRRRARLLAEAHERTGTQRTN